MIKRPQVTASLAITALLTVVGLLLSACSSGNTPSVSQILKLDAKRLTFVFFYTPT